MVVLHEIYIGNNQKCDEQLFSLAVDFHFPKDI